MIEVYFSATCNAVPVYSMDPSQFLVYENSVAVQDFSLQCADPQRRCPMTVSLVLDASQSMAGAFNAAVRFAATSFIATMDGRSDSAAVVYFNDTVRVLQPLTRFKDTLTTAVQSLPAKGETALWDGIELGMLQLRGSSQCQAIIALADGRDNKSITDMTKIIAAANARRIRIFTIGLGGDIDSVKLAQVATSTGGVFYNAPSPASLDSIFTEISSIISQGFRECQITYRATCSQEDLRIVDLQLHSFCGGIDIRSGQYRTGQSDLLPRPKITAQGPTRFCDGDSVVVDVTQGFSSYVWTGGLQGSRVTLFRSGRYMVSVTDTNGCQGTDTISVRVDTLPTARVLALGPTRFCEGDSVLLDAGSEARAFRWNTGDTTHVVVARHSGTYLVTVTGDNGCRNQSPPVLVDAFSIPRPSIMGRNPVCAGETTSFLGSAVPGARSTWTITGGTAVGRVDTTALEVQWTNEGMAHVRYRLTVDSVGCFAESDTLVDVRPPFRPVISVLGSSRFCAGDSTVLDAGPSHLRYRWSTGDTTRSIVARTEGRYQVTITSDIGCHADTATLLRVDPLPSFVIEAQPGTELCDGDSARLRVQPDFPAYTWSTGETARDILVRSRGLYVVTVTDSNGCRSSQSQRLIVHDLPPVPIIDQQDSVLVCLSDVSRGYQWYFDGLPLPGATLASVLGARDGRYAVEIVDSNGCRSRSLDRDLVLRPFASLSLSCAPDLLYRSGTPIFFPVVLDTIHVAPGTATEYTLHVSFVRNTLVLMPDPGMSITDVGPRRHVIVRGTRAEQARTGILTSLRFVAAVGDSACGTVRIDSVLWSDTRPRLLSARQECTVCMDICREGGPRTFRAGGHALLGAPSPNPTNGPTRVTWSLLEAGPTRLSLYDALGRERFVLVSDLMNPGAYSRDLDAGQFPSGLYFLVLLTPTQRLITPMEIVK